MNKNSLVLDSKLFRKWREKFNSQNLSIASVKVKLVISRTLKDFYLAVLDVNLKKNIQVKLFQDA